MGSASSFATIKLTMSGRFRAPMTVPSCSRDPVRMITIDAAQVRAAEKLIESCEQCNPEAAVIPFDVVLDQVTGSDLSVTDYILEAPAKCPHCRRDILEDTC